MTEFWRKNELVYDVIFFVNQGSRGWILDRICRELAYHTGLHCKVIYTATNSLVLEPIPASRSYFFSHFELAMNLFCDQAVRKGNKFVYFTHPDPSRNTDITKLLSTLKQCDKTYVMNTRDLNWLSTIGVPANQINVMVGGVDCDVFALKNGGSKIATRQTVGVVSAFYQRKNPELLLEVIKNNRDMDFHLIAPGNDHTNNPGLVWSNFIHYDELCAQDNFRLIETDYANYIDEFSNFSTYLSLSKVEGGPIPLLECLALGIPAVVTDTGFAPDVVKSGVNGMIVSVSSTSDRVREALLATQKLDSKICRKSVQKYTWKSMAASFLTDHVGSTTICHENDLYNARDTQMYLGAGWHDTEEFGIWSKDLNAELSFHTGSSAEDKNLKLKVNVTDPTVTHKILNITFSDSGYEQKFEVPTNVVTELTVKMPKKIEAMDYLECNITVDKLTAANCINPDDNRMLGVFLRSVILAD